MHQDLVWKSYFRLVLVIIKKILSSYLKTKTADLLAVEKP